MKDGLQLMSGVRWIDQHGLAALANVEDHVISVN